jgi:hypothetical protein
MPHPPAPDTTAPPRPSPDGLTRALSSLGVLLVFCGLFGFVAFAFGSVDTRLRPLAEVAVVGGLALGARLATRRGVLVGRSLTWLTGALAPVAAVAALYDSAPPEPGGLARVGLAAAIALAFAGVYAHLARQRDDSPLRFLVHPTTWFGVGLAALVTRDHLPDGRDVASISGWQGAAMIGALAGSLLLTRRSDDPRAAGARRASAVVGAVGALLTSVALSWGTWTVGEASFAAAAGLATVALAASALPTAWRRGATAAAGLLTVVSAALVADLAADVTAQIVAGAGLLLVVRAALGSGTAAGRDGLLGHGLTVGAALTMAGDPPGRVAPLLALVAGLVVTAVRQESDGSPVVALVSRALATSGAVGERARRAVELAPARLAALTAPLVPLAILAFDGRLTGSDPWSVVGVTFAATALVQALVARFVDLRTVRATTATIALSWATVGGAVAIVPWSDQWAGLAATGITLSALALVRPWRRAASIAVASAVAVTAGGHLIRSSGLDLTGPVVRVSLLTALAVAASVAAVRRPRLATGGQVLAVIATALAWVDGVVSSDLGLRGGVALTGPAAAAVLLAGALNLRRGRIDQRWIEPWTILAGGALFTAGMATTDPLVGRGTPGWIMAASTAATAVALVLMAQRFRSAGLRILAVVALAGSFVFAAVAADPSAMAIVAVATTVALGASLVALAAANAPTFVPWRSLTEVLAGSAILVVAAEAAESGHTGSVAGLALALGAVSSATTAIVRRRPRLALPAPLLLAGAWCAAVAPVLGGDAQWFVVPIGAALLAVVDLDGFVRRSRDEEPAVEASVVDGIGVALVVLLSLVRTFAGDLLSAPVAVGLGGLVALWGLATHLRRRTVAGVTTLVAAPVIAVAVPLVRSVPRAGAAGAWLLVAAVGVVVLGAAWWADARRDRPHGRGAGRLGH